MERLKWVMVMLAMNFAVTCCDQTWTDIAENVDAVTGVAVRRVKLRGSVVRFSGRVGDVIKRVWDFDFPMTTEGMIYATQFSGADAQKSARELGVRYRDVAETFGDALRWMYRAGHVDAAAVGRLVDD